MKSKEKRVILILMIVFIITLLNINIIDFRKQFLRNDKNTEDTSLFNLKNSGHWVFEDTTIFIDSSNPIYNWTWAESQDWCIGSGTMGDPYIIENLTMIGYDYQASIWIIDFIDPNVYFIIKNCTFIDTPSALDIWDANNTKFFNNTFSNAYMGIDLSYCEYNTIFGNKFYGGYVGIYFNGGFGHNITDNEFYNVDSGLRIVDDAYDCLIYSNIFYDNMDGIYLRTGENNNFSSNIMNGCGFNFDYEPGRAETNIIETTNLVNGKPLYYYKNELNLTPLNFTNAGQVILINCNNSQISNLNLSYTNYGISLIKCNNNTLTKINCSNNNYYGFFLRECYNVTLDNNSASHNKDGGIFLNNGHGYNLTNNQMIDCGLVVGLELKDYYLNYIDTTNTVNNKLLYYLVNETGLDSSSIPNSGQLILIDCNKSSFEDLILNNCTIGIFSQNCFNNEFTNITSNFNKIGIYFYKCSNNSIIDCNISHCTGYGIQIYSSSYNNSIIGSILSNNQRSGLYAGGYESMITGNTIINNEYYGLGLGGQYNNATDNIISNNDESGIYLSGSYNKISENNITNNYGYGIQLWGSNNLISENNISNNENHGVYTEGGNDNIILENLIKNCNGTGIYMYRGDNFDVIGNDIKFNDEFGIILHDGTNFNTIYNNNFTGNFLNAEDNGTINFWDNGVIGNYWDDYIGEDANDDGIGDTPYTNISGTAGTQDDYPIWWDPPVFFIISPLDGQTFGGNAPNFIIEIEKGIPDYMWYTLNDLPTKYFFTTNNTINQGAWEAVSGTTIKIAFYINDSAGKVGYDDVMVKKDNVIPIIIINLPLQSEEFGKDPPTFELVIIEDFLADTWYTLNDGITNHSCSLSGQINQTLWIILPKGTYNLRFYARDTAGNIGFSEVSVLKTAPSIIPSFDILVIFLAILISLVSISWHIRKER